MKKTEDNQEFYELLHKYLKVNLPIQRKSSPATIKNYRDSIQQFRLYLENEKKIPFTKVGFDCFSRDMIYGFCVWLRDAKQLSVRTVNLRLTVLKSFLKYCGQEVPDLETYHLKACSIKAFKGPVENKLEYLKEAQVRELLAAADISTKIGRRDQGLMVLAYQLATRVSELINIRLGDIVRDGDTVEFIIHGKGNKTRLVPLAPEAVPHLESYLHKFHPDGQNSDLLFFTVHDGIRTKMSPRNVNAILARYALKLHAEDDYFPVELHCHVLRHSMAMNLIRQGFALPYIRDFLGHESLQTTLCYAHTDGEMLEKAIREINQDALPATDQDGKTDSKPKKKWKDDASLLAYCGLG